MSKPGPFRRAEVALLPYLVAPGLGFLSVVLSAVLTARLMFRLAELLGDAAVVRISILTILGQLWAWAVLPVLAYGVARVVRLRPWVISVGGIGTGLFFVLMLSWLSRGVEGIIREHPLRLALLLLTSGVGVWLTRRAIRAAEAASARVQEAALKAAEAKKSQYDEFVREAERIAALKEAREKTGS
ncbi:MAG: hypothetical protein WBV82_23825 [Myxococcaceae bacterium]